MRWTGQWPQHATTDFTQDNIAEGDEQLDGARQLPNQMMAIDHNLHQQLQQQFCVEQFQLLNQLQVSKLKNFIDCLCIVKVHLKMIIQLLICCRYRINNPAPYL